MNVSEVTLCKSKFESNIKRDASNDIQNIHDLLKEEQLTIAQVRNLKQYVTNIIGVITTKNTTANAELLVVTNNNSTQINQLTSKADSYRNYGWFWKFCGLFPYVESNWRTKGCEIDTFINNNNKQLNIDIQDFQTNVTSAQNYLTKIDTLLNEVIHSGNVTPQNIEKMNYYIMQFNSILPLHNTI